MRSGASASVPNGPAADGSGMASHHLTKCCGDWTVGMQAAGDERAQGPYRRPRGGILVPLGAESVGQQSLGGAARRPHRA